MNRGEVAEGSVGSVGPSDDGGGRVLNLGEAGKNHGGIKHSLKQIEHFELFFLGRVVIGKVTGTKHVTL